MPYRRHESGYVKTLESWNGFYNHGITFPSSNRWGFPDVKAYRGPLPEKLVPYNEMGRGDGTGWAHFFIDDNKFNSIWTYPARAVCRLKNEVAGCLGPDFSMYSDWPRVVQMYNWYRSLWCMSLWQAEGIKVIPTVCWSDPRSWSWCFKGLPSGGTVAISTVGILRSYAARLAFWEGFEAMQRQLEPRRILCYGRVPESLREHVTRGYADKWRQIGK